jgi:hypothetical protein
MAGLKFPKWAWGGDVRKIDVQFQTHWRERQPGLKTTGEMLKTFKNMKFL